MPNPRSYTCPFCGRESHNPHDLEMLYCAACQCFADDALQQIEMQLTLANVTGATGVAVPLFVAKAAVVAIREKLARENVMKR